MVTGVGEGEGFAEKSSEFDVVEGAESSEVKEEVGVLGQDDGAVVGPVGARRGVWGWGNARGIDARVFRL